MQKVRLTCDILTRFTSPLLIAPSAPDSLQAAPYIKAAVRDMKAFRDARGYRSIPISYSTADLGDRNIVLGQYLTCGDSSNSIELLGLNVYTWCGNSSYWQSSYNNLYENFQPYNVPVLFSETGCKVSNQTRDFGDVSVILGSLLPYVFSGAIVYEWPNQTNGYGIVSYANADYTGFPSTLEDYNHLSTAFAAAHPTGTAMASYTPSNSQPSCPSSDSSAGWPIDAKQALPTISGLNLATVTARTTLTSQTGQSLSSSVPSSSSSAAATTAGNQSGSSGLASGAIAGIVIGCVVALAAVAAAVFFCIKKRKRAGTRAESQKNQMSQEAPKTIWAGQDYGSNGQRTELPAQSTGYALPRQEMDAQDAGNHDRRPVEEMHEMAADTAYSRP